MVLMAVFPGRSDFGRSISVGRAGFYFFIWVFRSLSDKPATVDGFLWVFYGAINFGGGGRVFIFLLGFPDRYRINPPLRLMVFDGFFMGSGGWTMIGWGLMVYHWRGGCCWGGNHGSRRSGAVAVDLWEDGFDCADLVRGLRWGRVQSP